MWEKLRKWENENFAVAYTVISTQDIKAELCHWRAFDISDRENEGFLCDIDEVPEWRLLEVMRSVENYIKCPVTFEGILEEVYAELVHEEKYLVKPQIYNSETKQFESYDDAFNKKEGEKQCQ